MCRKAQPCMSTHKTLHISACIAADMHAHFPTHVRTHARARAHAYTHMHACIPLEASREHRYTRTRLPHANICTFRKVQTHKTVFWLMQSMSTTCPCMPHHKSGLMWPPPPPQPPTSPSHQHAYLLQHSTAISLAPSFVKAPLNLMGASGPNFAMSTFALCAYIYAHVCMLSATRAWALEWA